MYLDITGVPFPRPGARKLQIPWLVTSAKITLCGPQFRLPLPGACEAAEGAFWNVFLGVRVSPLVASDRAFLQHVNKRSLRLLLRAGTGVSDCKNMQTV